MVKEEIFSSQAWTFVYTMYICVIHSNIKLTSITLLSSKKRLYLCKTKIPPTFHTYSWYLMAFIEKERIQYFQKVKSFNSLCRQMQPNDTKYHDKQNNLFENIRNDRNNRNILIFDTLKIEREKWNFITEARNSRGTCTVIPSMKNAFGYRVSEPIKKLTYSTTDSQNWVIFRCKKKLYRFP